MANSSAKQRTRHYRAVLAVLLVAMLFGAGRLQAIVPISETKGSGVTAMDGLTCHGGVDSIEFKDTGLRVHGSTPIGYGEIKLFSYTGELYGRSPKHLSGFTNVLLLRLPAQLFLGGAVLSKEDPSIYSYRLSARQLSTIYQCQARA